MKIDNLSWYQGRTLKRNLDVSGASPEVETFLIAAWLTAQEKGIPLTQLTETLAVISQFETPTRDKAKTLRELGF